MDVEKFYVSRFVWLSGLSLSFFCLPGCCTIYGLRIWIEFMYGLDNTWPVLVSPDPIRSDLIGPGRNGEGISYCIIHIVQSRVVV